MGWFDKRQESRICVMETLLEEFQGNMERHMHTEEVAFKGIKADLKEIITHIDNSQKEALQATTNMKTELLHTIEKGYYTQLEVEKQLTGLRDSIMQEVGAKKDQTVKDLRMGVLLVVVTMSACGWWYVNVAIPAAAHHVTTGVKK